MGIASNSPLHHPLCPARLRRRQGFLHEKSQSTVRSGGQVETERRSTARRFGQRGTSKGRSHRRSTTGERLGTGAAGMQLIIRCVAFRLIERVTA